MRMRLIKINVYRRAGSISFSQDKDLSAELKPNISMLKRTFLLSIWACPRHIKAPKILLNRHTSFQTEHHLPRSGHSGVPCVCSCKALSNGTKPYMSLTRNPVPNKIVRNKFSRIKIQGASYSHKKSRNTIFKNKMPV
jgi:hypothetical protein